jgi:hypothetical protein
MILMGKTNKFIEQSKLVHGDRYDYSKVNYIDNITKVIIICTIHGEFEQTPHGHKRGNGCKHCTMGRDALSSINFLNKANLKHNNKFTYDLSNYVNTRSKIKITCNEHGIFTQNCAAHLNGQGCPKCGVGGRISLIEVLSRFNNIHGDKYTYITDSYYNVSDSIDIICNNHGKFNQRVIDHLAGSGCPRCVGRGKTTNEFINEAKEKHGDMFDYSLVDYVTTYEKLTIICPKHGEFKQSPRSHLKGSGCPICKESKGERKIRLLLDKKNINYLLQYRFSDCKHIKPLPFDFYLPEHNICIEFNGRQHYEPVKSFGGEKEFEKTKLRDEIKLKFCIKQNIKLISIHYKDDVIKTLEMELK